MKLYALSVAAMHNGEPPSAIGVQTAIVALPEGVSVEDASLQVARVIFPESDGWGKHYANAVEITQGFPLEPYRLVWHLEKSE
ncbi:MAG TPA: hypothetical protein VFU22_28445 [Roseiflexaceae bacterium]|nr:hypothetical protein [Roseiflexaceae bacterium]